MDIPCAILIAAFCLPDANFKLEVKAGPEGSVATVTSGEVRARILLSDEGGAPTPMTTQLCREGVCVDYSARVREEASSVELLIAAGRGQEHFIQLRGPLQAVADLSTQMSYVVEARRRWVQIPLSEFLTAIDRDQAQPQ
jgi:hypothetical protein